jgi:hypothetical protein
MKNKRFKKTSIMVLVCVILSSLVANLSVLANESFSVDPTFDRHAFPIGIYVPPAPHESNSAVMKEIADMNVNFIVGGNSNYYIDTNQRILDLSFENDLDLLVAHTSFLFKEGFINQFNSDQEVTVAPGQSWVQSFQVPLEGEGWSIYDVNFAVSDWPEEAILKVVVYGADSVSGIRTSEKVLELANMSYIPRDEEGYLIPKIGFGEFPVNKGQTYYFELSTTHAEGIKIRSNSANVYPEGMSYLNGAAQAGDLRFKVDFGAHLYQEGFNGTERAMPSPEALGTVSDYFKHHPAMMGYTLLDEPSADEFPGVEATMNILKESDPYNPSFVNLYPSEAQSPDLRWDQLKIDANATTEELSSAKSLGQTFRTGSDQTGLHTVQWFVDQATWSNEEELTLTLWDSQNKEQIVARQTLNRSEVTDNWPVFTLHAEVEPGTMYYMELTHNGGGNDAIAVTRSVIGHKWYNFGNAYIEGSNVKSDFWYTINRIVEGFSYDDYVYRWVRAEPEYIGFDTYPFRVNGLFEAYYYNLETIRRQSKESELDFWSFLQSIGFGDQNEPLSARVPNEDDLRYNIFTNLAYGAKGLMYFTYKTPPYPYFIDGIIRPDGTKYQSYEWARKLNEQLLYLGPTLTRLTSQEVYHHSPGSLPRGTKGLPQDFFWQPNQGDVPQIISTFHDEEGVIYVMVVNRNINETGGPSPGNQTLTFSLDQAIHNIVEISKESGREKPANFNTSTGVLSAVFAPGEGKLYKTNLRADLNRKPVAYSLYKEIADLNPVEGTLSANDPDGDALVYELVGNPSGGEVVLGSGGTFTFTPDQTFSKTGSFSYRTTDDKADSNVATVTVALASENSGNDSHRAPAVADVSLSPGNAVGTTQLLAQPEAGNAIMVQVSQQPVSVPRAGNEAPPLTEYDGSELPAAVGEYVAVYEVDSNNKIVRFSLLSVKLSHIQTKIGFAFEGKFPIAVNHTVKPQEGSAFLEQVDRIRNMNANLIIASDSVNSIAYQKQLLQEASDKGVKVLAGYQYAKASETISQPEVNMVYGVLPWYWHGQLFTTPANSGTWSLESIALNTKINAAEPLQAPVNLELIVYESPDRSKEITRSSLVLPAGESGEHTRTFTFSGAALEPDKQYYMQLMTDSISNTGIGYYNQANTGYDSGGAYVGGHASQLGEYRNYEDLAYEISLAQVEGDTFTPDSRPSDEHLSWLFNELGDYNSLLGYNLQRRAYEPLYDQLAAAAAYLKTIDPDRLSYVSLPGVDRNGGFLNPSQLIRERVRTKPGQTLLQSIKMSNGMSTNIWAPARVNVYDAETESLLGQSVQIHSKPADSQPTFTFSPPLSLAENTEYIFELDLDNGYEDQVWTNWRIDPYGTLEVDGQLKGGKLFTTINGEEHDDQVSDWMGAAASTGLLVMDSYNYHHGGVQLDNYFLLLDRFSKQAKENGVPLWATIQSAAESFQSVPVPVTSQGQMRFQAYAALGYGAKGLLYSAYASDANYTDALVGSDGTPAASYGWAQQLNSEVAELGEVMLQLELERVYHAYPANDIPELGVSKLQADDWVQLPSDTPRVMISTFTDTEGQRYWLAVNKDTENAQDFTFIIPSAPSQLLEVSKTDGEHVPVLNYNELDGSFNATLAPGEGKLYKMTYVLSAADHSVSVKQGEIFKGDLPASGLVYAMEEHPSKGIVYLDRSTGGFEYVPHQGAVGNDSFQYKVSNGTKTETATVHLNIVPYAPEVTGGAAIAIDNGGVGIMASAGQNERLVLRTSKEQMYQRSIERFKTPHVGDPAPVGYDVIDNYTGGNLDLETDLPLGEGSYIGVYVVGNDNAIRAFSLLRYTMNHAPVSQNVSLDAYAGQNSQGTFLATDADEDTLTFRIWEQPAQGHLRVDRHSNRFIYTPRKGASGTDTFTYYAIDGKDRSNYSTVTVTLQEQQGGGGTSPGTGVVVVGGGTPPDTEGEGETPSGANLVFNDIKGHWAEASILEAARRGIILGFGDDTFRPQHEVTRAQFIVMLQRVLQFEGSESNRSFSDLHAVGSWARSPLLKAVEAGWLTGYPDGTLRPNAPITRTEMAMMITRALGLQLDNSHQPSFADAEQIPNWGKAAVEAARSNGLLRGQANNRFNPGANTTRAEAATLMLRLIVDVE